MSDLAKALSAGVASSFISLPKMSVSMSPIGLRFEEDKTIAINPHASIMVNAGCVLSQQDKDHFTFSAPYPTVRVQYLVKWDGKLRGVAVDQQRRKITIQIDGMPDVSVGY